MKVGIVGVGAVGASALLSMTAREAADEIVLIDTDRGKVAGITADIQYGAFSKRPTCAVAGDYPDLHAADLVIVAAGLNEKAGGAADRTDPVGRMRLLGENAGVIREVIPKIVDAAPDAIVLIVTNPPEPLAELARRLTGRKTIFSVGTMIDTLRFRFHLAECLGVAVQDIIASVVGEHGNGRVLLWSTARVGPTLVTQMLASNDLERVRAVVDRKVRDANIEIIEKIGASRYGIGTCCGRLAQALATDEETLFDLGSYIPEFGMTLAFPTLVRRGGFVRALIPEMDGAERKAVDACAVKLQDALRQLPGRADPASVAALRFHEAHHSMPAV